MLSVRIRRELKERMEEFRDIDWRSEIERFIESRIRELEVEKVLKEIEEVLKGVEGGGEEAWVSVRELREGVEEG